MRLIQEGWIPPMETVEVKYGPGSDGFMSWSDPMISFVDKNGNYDLYTFYELVFNKKYGLAKFKWGEENIEFETLAGKVGYVAWEYHIQRMAVLEDPVTYFLQN